MSAFRHLAVVTEFLLVATLICTAIFAYGAVA